MALRSKADKEFVTKILVDYPNRHADTMPAEPTSSEPIAADPFAESMPAVESEPTSVEPTTAVVRGDSRNLGTFGVVDRVVKFLEAGTSIRGEAANAIVDIAPIGKILVPSF